MAVTNNASPLSAPGQNQNAGDRRALFEKIFSGEILTAFVAACQTYDKQFIRTITSGSGAKFPVIGTAAAKYHKPGQNILEEDNAYLNQIATTEKVINIDDLLVAPTFVANIDELMNHYEVRSKYAKALGDALAQAWDRRSLQTFILAARSGPNITATPAGFGGTVLPAAAAWDTDPLKVVDALFEAAATLDDKNVPKAGRYAFLRNRDYYGLVKAKEVINKLYGGDGLISEGVIHRLAGLTLQQTNNLPSTNIAAIDGEKNTYSGNFTKTKALVFHDSAIGTVKLLDLSFEQEWKIEYQGTLMLAKYAIGTGILRPESAIEIASA
jgi:hypothetical protein